ncbi:hypothetical protein [Actinomadura rubrisoli]|uniref:Uncharacterized protein n=1 Tax=Actinomadura rubrisoli TaxID=2530368 RepID=A0A4R5AP36_9ACTN|nr:hypothetical protein [Actinomadura rubrisoli]TDD73530.1 hypothetical protein E1298_33860 [Actinomadura rubrisoli]
MHGPFGLSLGDQVSRRVPELPISFTAHTAGYPWALPAAALPPAASACAFDATVSTILRVPLPALLLPADLAERPGLSRRPVGTGSGASKAR